MGNRQAYEDPTAAEAIGNVMKEFKRKNSDCFALRKCRCSTLNVKKCDGKSCGFYKTPKQIEEEKKMCFERIRSLDKEEQFKIAEKYYGNKMPWF